MMEGIIMEKVNEKVVKVEIWGGDALSDWQDYDCPNNVERGI